MTRYRYDGFGRLSESITEHDPEWTDEDMAAALDWLRDRKLRCSCGHRIDETTRDDRAMNFYDAEVKQCHACAQGERAEAAARENSTESTLPPGAKTRIWERG